MNNDDSYKIVFTNEMLRSIGIDTNNDNIEVEITIENGIIKICRSKKDV
jgi:hypothetical protein